MKRLNIVYIHTHDLGRYCEPMGYAIPAPNLMKLAGQGTLFRNFHSSAPSCAPSRAALVTGEPPHCCGMLGLPMHGQLGYHLNDYSKHLAGFLRRHGYETALSGVQHVACEVIAPKEKVLPYDHFLNHTPSEQQEFIPALTAPAAIDFLMKKHEKPFFLSVGFLDPHRDNRDDRSIFIESQPMHEPADIVEQSRYCQPWPHMPDNRTTRREMANFKLGVELMDADVGKVLKVLDLPQFRENTLVIFTTDHGPGVCEMKCTLTDRGTGAITIIRGPSDLSYGAACEFNGGKIIDGMAQHMDLYPTICDLIGKERPEWLHGESLLPLVTGEKEEIHNEIFSEQTYHDNAVPRPLRAIRTPRYKYIRSFKCDQQRGADRGPAQAFWEEYGYAGLPFADEMLFDLIFDPHEANNLATSQAHQNVLTDLRGRLQKWMEETGDPLADGTIPEPPAVKMRRHRESQKKPAVTV